MVWICSRVGIRRKVKDKTILSCKFSKKRFSKGKLLINQVNSVRLFLSYGENYCLAGKSKLKLIETLVEILEVIK